MSAELEVIKPWERQPEEGEEAYEAFVVYRDLGSARGVRGVGTELDKSRQLMGRWSARHRWVERAAAWDRFVARQENEQFVLGRAEMRGRHIRNAKNLQVQIGQAIAQMTPRQIAMLKPRDMATMLRAATEMERKAREVGTAELESGKSDFAPTFIVEFVASKPADMIQVRMADGVMGFIPPTQQSRFLADHPDAVIVQTDGETTTPPTSLELAQ